MIHHLNGKFHAFFIRSDGSIAGIFKSKKGGRPKKYPHLQNACERQNEAATKHVRS